MYDIHCHILPGVDDGPANAQDALKVAEAAEHAGIEAIVCTPHYIEDGYKSSSEDNLSILDGFKKALRENGIRLELYLSNEVYITPDIIRLLDTGRISTINNSRYILIEMSVYNKPVFIEEVIYQLKLRGLVPVVAHPERYEWVRRMPKDLSNFIRRGCLVQLNTGSISGYYGDGARRTAKALLRENCIHLLGSDSHTSTIIYDRWKADLRLLQKASSEYRLSKIVQNAEAVLKNHCIEGC